MACKVETCKSVDDSLDVSTAPSDSPTDSSNAQEYDFVEPPSEDYLCPVTLELLLEPLQTVCCGHHLSNDVATKLQGLGKPCPMCKEPNLSTVADKFFKRKVNELKVRCRYTESGCAWVGELSYLDQHEEFCPKRPWECEYCPEKGAYELQKEHANLCPHYPTPCPNKCDVGTVVRCELDDHLAVCPDQPITCEFSHAGCTETVQRKHMAQHMEERMQQHILSATLLNLTLTKDMQGRIRGIEDKLEAMETQMSEMHTKMDENNGEMSHLQGQTSELQEQIKELRLSILAKQGTFTFTLASYSPKRTNWTSSPFYVPSRGQYTFELNITNVNSTGDIVASLKPLKGENDDNLSWPITVMGRLTLLNQLGDHDHHSVGFKMKLSKHMRNWPQSITSSLIPISNLGSTTQPGTKYLKDNRLCFELFMSVSPS